MREVREDIQRMQDYLVARKLPLLEELDEWKCNMRDLTRSAVQRMEVSGGDSLPPLHAHT